MTTTIRESSAITPVFVTNSKNEYFSAVPIIMFGGSPHIVDEPPRFAQKISVRIIGTGLNQSSFASSTVTAASNRMTVILSLNIASTADITMNVIKIGIT